MGRKGLANFLLQKGTQPPKKHFFQIKALFGLFKIENNVIFLI